MRTLRPSALSRTLALASPAVSLVVQRAEAQFNAYVKFDDITGESKDTVHANWCTAASFNWGVAKPYTLGGSSGPTSAATLVINKAVDRASPTLFLRSTTGTHLSTVTLELSHTLPTGTVAVFYKIVLSDVVITKISSGGDTAATTGNGPTESIELSYTSMAITYTQYDAKGGQTVLPTVTYDFAAQQGK